MGRPRGSKNKSTLLKEALKAAAGKTGAEVATKVQVATSAPVLAVAPEPPKPAERKPENLPIWRLSVHRLELLRSYYGSHAQIDERFWTALERVHTAANTSEAENIAEKVVDSFSMSMMAAWAKGLADGPPSVSRWKKLVSSRQGLIKLLQKKPGNDTKIAEYQAEIDAANKQMETVAEPPPPWQTTRWNFVA